MGNNICMGNMFNYSVKFNYTLNYNSSPVFLELCWATNIDQRPKCQKWHQTIQDLRPLIQSNLILHIAVSPHYNAKYEVFSMSREKQKSKTSTCSVKRKYCAYGHVRKLSDNSESDLLYIPAQNPSFGITKLNKETQCQRQ